MIIRRAEPKDVPAVLEMLRAFIASCPTEYPEADQGALTLTTIRSFHKTSPILALVAEEDGKILGLGTCLADACLWARIAQGRIPLILVRPDRRGGLAFPRLLGAVEEWAKEKKCVSLSWEIAAGLDDEALAKMLEKRDWKRVGIGMVKALTA